MSTDLITYLNFIAGLEYATDEQKNDMISERAKFIAIGQSNSMANSNSAINEVFDNIDKLARQLEEEEIAQESVKLGEDVAAVTALFTFGWSMAAFAAAAVTDVALGAAIKVKENELYNALSSADQEIATKIGGVVEEYTGFFQKNNAYFQASNPQGLTAQTSRSYMYNYMDFLSVHVDGGVTLENFNKYLEVARMTMNDEHINDVYNLLDTFTLSNQGPEEIKNALDGINNSGVLQAGLEMTRSLTYFTWMYKMNVASKDIIAAAAEAGCPPEEITETAFENMGAVGMAVACFTIMVSVIDALLVVYSIIETIQRYQQNIKNFEEAREQYKQYYGDLYEAASKYKPES